MVLSENVGLPVYAWLLFLYKYFVGWLAFVAVWIE